MTRRSIIVGICGFPFDTNEMHKALKFYEEGKGEVMQVVYVLRGPR